MKVTSSKDDTGGKDILLYGPPGHGKTVAAATASQHCPDTLPAGKSTSLDDMLWLQFDRGGVSSLTPHNLSVDVLDLSGESDWRKIRKLLPEVVQVVNTKVKEGLEWVVVDTLTSMDAVLVSTAKEEFDVRATMQAWGYVLQEHARFYDMLRSLPVSLLLLCHAKSIIPADEDLDTKTKRKAAGTDTSTMAPAISGSAVNRYIANSSYVWAVQAKPIRGKTEREYKILPYPANGFATKSRYNGWDAEEPANIKKLFEKKEQSK